MYPSESLRTTKLDLCLPSEESAFRTGWFVVGCLRHASPEGPAQHHSAASSMNEMVDFELMRTQGSTCLDIWVDIEVRVKDKNSIENQGRVKSHQRSHSTDS